MRVRARAWVWVGDCVSEQESGRESSEWVRVLQL